VGDIPVRVFIRVIPWDFLFDMTDYNFTFGDDDSESQHILTYGGEVKNDMIDSTDLGERDSVSGALFIQDVWQPADMEDLKITAGIRYDYNQIYGSQLNPRVRSFLSPPG